MKRLALLIAVGLVFVQTVRGAEGAPKKTFWNRLRSEGEKRPVPENAPVINYKRFAIEYAVSNAVRGRSGVAKVEMYLTNDMGLTWKKYGEDPDRTSPFIVEVPTDGAYGFAIACTDSNGNGERAPFTGMYPEQVIVVDSSAPVAEFISPRERSGLGPDGIVISWKCTDAHMGTDGVTIQYSGDRGENWYNLKSKLPATGELVWKPRTVHAPTYVFRLQANDRAGNTATVNAPGIILIDVTPPSIAITGPKRPEGTDVSITYTATDPAGIAWVELWTTDDGGRNWQLYARDNDNRSPILYKGEGIERTGFALRAADRLGNVTPALTPGHKPELELVMDATGPDLTLGSFAEDAKFVTGGSEQSISWFASDPHMKENSVMIEWSADGGQTWEPIASNLPSKGSHKWLVPSGSDRPMNSCLLRVIAFDTLGNRSVVQSVRPFTVVAEPVTSKLIGKVPTPAEVPAETANEPMTITGAEEIPVLPESWKHPSDISLDDLNAHPSDETIASIKPVEPKRVEVEPIPAKPVETEIPALPEIPVEPTPVPEPADNEQPVAMSLNELMQPLNNTTDNNLDVRAVPEEAEKTPEPARTEIEPLKPIPLDALPPIEEIPEKPVVAPLPVEPLTADPVVELPVKPSPLEAKPLPVPIPADKLPVAPEDVEDDDDDDLTIPEMVKPANPLPIPDAPRKNVGGTENGILPLPKPEALPPAVGALPTETKNVTEAVAAGAERVHSARVMQLVREAERSLEDREFAIARERASQALAMDDTVARAYLVMGLIEANTEGGELKKAIGYVEKAIACDQKDDIAHMAMGEYSLAEAKRLQEHYNKGLSDEVRASPEDLMPLSEEINRNIRNALRSYSVAANLQPNEKQPHDQLGAVYYFRGLNTTDPALRVRAFRDAAEAYEAGYNIGRPNYQEAFRLGRIYYTFLNEPDKGARYLREAIKVGNPDGEPRECYWYLAEIATKNNHLDDALYYWKQTAKSYAGEVGKKAVYREVALKRVREIERQLQTQGR